MEKTKYILASASPRRNELLKSIVSEFEVIVPDVEEFSHYVRPHLIVQELAKQKCMTVADTVTSNSVIIAADTLVVHKGHMLGKPKDKEQAFIMLKTLQNNWHRVYTGVCIYSTRREQATYFYDKTKVHMTSLTNKQINDYIATGSSMDKAGAYGIQDLNGTLIDKIVGSYNNVVGLPTEMLRKILSSNIN